MTYDMRKQYDSMTNNHVLHSHRHFVFPAFVKNIWHFLFTDCDGTNYLVGVAYPGNDLNNTHVNSAEECQAFCKKIPDCKVWTWGNQECYAKTGIGRTAITNKISGTRNACPKIFQGMITFLFRFFKEADNPWSTQSMHGLSSVKLFGWEPAQWLVMSKGCCWSKKLSTDIRVHRAGSQLKTVSLSKGMKTKVDQHIPRININPIMIMTGVFDWHSHRIGWRLGVLSIEA